MVRVITQRQSTKTKWVFASVEVLDLNGKVLQTNLLHQELMLDLSTYQKGMYVIKVQMNGVNIIERIAVQ